MGAFRVAIDGAFVKPDGTPAYPDFDLEPLRDTPGMDVQFVQLGAECPPEALEGFDALILLGARFTRASVPRDGQLRIVARFGVGYDTVDVEACTDAEIALTITPSGVRRPVAVAILTLLLALAGKLMVKDRLTRHGSAGLRQTQRLHGHGADRAHARLGRDRQHRRRDVPHRGTARDALHRARSLRRPGRGGRPRRHPDRPGDRVPGGRLRHGQLPFVARDAPPCGRRAHRAHEADRLPHQHGARADRGSGGADPGAGGATASRAPGWTCRSRSRPTRPTSCCAWTT